ncbi:MAG: hypothetical protein JO093_15660 [Acidobacteria bacterium]|nr:hypothetical protein [Acidobacteriota bacterium]MBV9070957.1 hypothetical protein [Acidobacteriota bacterium]MBV9187051.1 hypothetical protein [Acidobacteriota bacterium]
MSKDRAAVSMLDAFCIANNITTPKLADAAEVSRQHVTRARYARTDVRIRIAKKIALGASRVVGRKVQVAEVFDLDFDFRARRKNTSHGREPNT